MHKALWQSVLGEIEVSVSPAAFATWFKNTDLIDHTDSEVVISVPNIFAKKQFEVKFNDQIKEVLAKNGVKPQQITYTISQQTKSVRNREADTETNVTENVRSSISIKPSNKNGLNPRYNFENFIVGSSNDLAYNASQAVADNPGSRYNPIYFYGGVGLGKTHLMQAIGNEIVTKNKDLKVMYISSETFVSEFMDHIRYKKKGFSDKYRNIDVLIVDDMQFIAGKEKTQEEFFHTFNHLHQNNKQIIISSDKPPKSIPNLTERLRSRFGMGMVIDIQMPEFETRCAILNAKASIAGINLDSSVIEFVAQNVKSNIRELEGVLNKLLAHSDLYKIDIDVSVAEGLLGDIRRSRPQYLTSKQIVDKVAKYFQTSLPDITGPKRDKHIVMPRQVAMYLLRSELHMSFPKIAAELGRKDHTTAIHSVEKIEKSVKVDFYVREQISSIRESLYV